MKALSILGSGALMLALAGCGTSDTVKKVKAMADRACACPNAACADKVDKEFWELVKTGQKRGTQSERDEVKTDYTRMRECIEKARSSATGTAAAPAGQPAEGGSAEGGSAPGGTAAGATAPPAGGKEPAK